MENNNDKKITTPQAIIAAGVVIMIAILVTRTNVNSKAVEAKTLSEKIGILKTAFNDCIKNTNSEVLSKTITDDVTNAMKAVPTDQRGTPYSVIVVNSKPVTDIRGAASAEDLKTLIDDSIAGKVKTKYEGILSPVGPNDHILGNPNAPVVIVEYSDYECPYCKVFHSTLTQTVKDSNSNVAWVYRNWPIHQHSFEKLVAAECVAKIKGNDAFWKYSDLLFGLLKTAQDPITDQL